MATYFDEDDLKPLRDRLDAAEKVYRDLYKLEGAPETLSAEDAKRALRDLRGKLEFVFLGDKPEWDRPAPIQAGRTNMHTAERFAQARASMDKRIEREGAMWFTRGVHKLRRRFRSDSIETSWIAFNTILKLVMPLIWPGDHVGESILVELFGQCAGIAAAEGNRAMGREEQPADALRKKLCEMGDKEAAALFEAMSKVFRYYFHKVQGHLNEGLKTYAWLYERLFEGDELDAQGRPQENPPKDLDQAITTCDDAVELVRYLYQFYHEIRKLRDYVQPLASYIQCLADLAEHWQKEWDDRKLGEVDPLFDILLEFDAAAHPGCEHTRLCYGPNKRDALGPARKVSSGSVTFSQDLGSLSRKRKAWLKANTEWYGRYLTRMEAEEEAFAEAEREFKELKKRRREDADDEATEMQKARIARFVEAAGADVGAGDDDAGKRFLALMEDAGLRSEFRGTFEGRWRYAKRYILTPGSRAKVGLAVFMLGVGIVLIPVTGGLSGAAAVAAAAGIIAGSKIVDGAVDWVEGAYDQDLLAGEERCDDAKRVRLRRNKDRSKQVASHFVSALKNFERIKRYRPTADGPLDDLTDCDTLLEYVWAGSKLHHHARKTVDYARPVLDVCETVHANLDRWEKFWNANVKRALEAVYAFVKTDEDAHDESCGTFARKPRVRLRLARGRENTTSKAWRLSYHCYGPPPRIGQQFLGEKPSQARFPIDLQVKGLKVKGEFEDLRNVGEQGDA